MKNLEQYVGREVKGVEFPSEHYRGITFNSRMGAYIGQEGTIVAYLKDSHSFRVSFESPVECHWHYPAEVILPQLEGELIGYLINTDDEKYVKIISGLTNVSVENLLELTIGGVHFTPKSIIGEIVAKYDLLDKCIPVYRQAKIKLPEINGYKGKDRGDYIKYGSTKLLKSWFEKSENSSISSLELDSGVRINKEEMDTIRKYLESKK